MVLDRAVTEADDVKYLDASLSAYAALSGQQMDALSWQMKDEFKPMLAHCESGADRTGLAPAMRPAVMVPMSIAA